MFLHRGILLACTRNIYQEVWGMSHQISYTPEYDKRYPSKRKSNGKKWIFVILLVVLLGVGLLSTTDHRSSIQIEMNNDKGHTDIFQTMLYEIRTGTPLQEAVTAFCKEVLLNG